MDKAIVLCTAWFQELAGTLTLHLHNTLTDVSLMQNQYHMGNIAKICNYLEIYPALLGHSFSGLYERSRLN